MTALFFHKGIVEINFKGDTMPRLRDGARGKRDFVLQSEKRKQMKRIQSLLDCNHLLDGWDEIRKRYIILSKIGEGTFSHVYKAREKNSLLALKSILPTSSETRIVNEIRILMELKNHVHISNLKTIHRREDRVLLVMPYFEHNEAHEYIRFLPISELRFYFGSLLSALRFCHSKEIIHRDVKPGNFLYHTASRMGVLVDFGLAQYYTPKQPQKTSRLVPTTPCLIRNDKREQINASRAGTRGFRAPEVLLKSQHQTCALDIWSSGVILLSFLTRKYPFFESGDDLEALQELTIIFGSRKMKNLAESLRIRKLT